MKNRVLGVLLGSVILLTANVVLAQPKPRPGDDKPGPRPGEGAEEKPEERDRRPTGNEDKIAEQKAKEEAEKKAQRDKALGAGNLHLSLDAAGLFPLGEFGDAAGVGAGGGARLSYRITGALGAHLRGMYTYHFESDAQTDPTTSFTQQWDQTIITVGLDYFIPLEDGQAVVISGGVGRDFITINTTFESSSAPVADQEADEDAWILLLLAGYDFDDFELRGGLSAFDTGGKKDEAQYAAMATFGYRIYDFF